MPSFALAAMHWAGDERIKALLLKYRDRTVVEAVGSGRNTETAKAILDGTLSAQSLNVDDPSHTDLAEQLLWSAAFGGAPEILRFTCRTCSGNAMIPGGTIVLAQPLRFSNHSPDSMSHDLDHSTYPVCFKIILEHAIDPDVLGTDGHTTMPHLATLAVIEEERLAFARVLLDFGASFNKRDSLLQSTPLSWACRWERIELVQLYLARGADALKPDAEP